jgi:uncharacterized membrane protein
MDDAQKIKELQEQINELSKQMQDSRQKLIALQNDLNLIQHKKISIPSLPAMTNSKSYRLETFIGLRIIHLVGIIVLVIGLSIGVKYAIDQRLISEASRIAFAYAAGVILYILSWKLKKKYLLFSAILLSGAMASLYFTTYAAFVYYGFFSFMITFLLMICFTIYTIFESMIYNRQEIAVLAMVGAYGIPFLISANTGRADLFFSYIILINAGIVYLSFKKKWKLMSQLAMLISWTLFILWGVFRYEPKNFWPGFISSVIFYLLFAISAMAHRLTRSEPLNIKDIQAILTNNIAFYFSSLIIFGYGDFGTHLASITAWIAALMLMLALLSYLFFPFEIILQRSMAIQVVLFLSLFIAFEWSGLIVTLLWVALAAILFIFGIYGYKSWARITAVLLMSVTLGKLVIFDSSKFSTIQKIAAYIIIGTLLLVLSFLYQKFKQTLFEQNNSGNE